MASILKTVRWRSLDSASRREILQRPAVKTRPEVEAAVRRITAEVRAGGDQALRALASELDGFDGDELRVEGREWDAGVAACPAPVRAALAQAAANIRCFHLGQVPRDLEVQVAPGILCRRTWRPIERVGLYVPAGTAPLPSTVLMLGIPAGIAGCKNRILFTPVGRGGKVHPGILAAARLAEVDAIYKVGGAHGVAALAYGTASIPKVDKIFGPGNAYVTAAKMLAAQDPEGAACDMPAGPSEVMVVVDDTADPRFAAADLLSQAEHGADSQVVLVAMSERILTATVAALQEQLAALPRGAIAAQALQRSIAIQVDGRAEALAVINAYAAEHLILQVQGAEAWTGEVQHAGSVFVGPWTPESVGDYASGTNHVLPTYGQARSYGGLTVEAFLKSMTVQELTPQGLAALGPVVETLADLEGLTAHRQAVSVRLAALAASPRDVIATVPVAQCGKSLEVTRVKS